LRAEGLRDASGKFLGSLFCHSIMPQCRTAVSQEDSDLDSTLVPLMSELGWHVQINMKYFVAMPQWQQPLFHIHDSKMLLCRIREHCCAIQAPVTSLL